MFKPGSFFFRCRWMYISKQMACGIRTFVINSTGGMVPVNTWTHWLPKAQLIWLALVVGAIAAFRASLLTWRPAVILSAAAVSALALTGFVALLVLYNGFRTGRWRGVRHCLGCVVLSLPPLVFVLILGLQGARTPPIHDISTDTSKPPQFAKARLLRGPGDNSAEYPGAAVGQQQLAAYSDIVPLETNLSPTESFAVALSVVDQLGWQRIAHDPGQGRIEAVDRSLLFGFTDDIVVRITADNGGSRIDIRSASRSGVGDLGVNAGRIRDFMQAFKENQPD
jgi:uncharacterized protein (DUF1499 family)